MKEARRLKKEARRLKGKASTVLVINNKKLQIRLLCTKFINLHFIFTYLSYLHMVNTKYSRVGKEYPGLTLPSSKTYRLVNTPTIFLRLKTHHVPC